MDTLYDLYLHFCYELAMKNWAKGATINSFGIHDLGHNHLLVCLQWSGLSDQWTLLLTEKYLQCQK